MGGKSSKAKISKYHMSVHWGVCHGPVDQVKAIYSGEKVAWQGYVTENTTLNINRDGLFGGIKKEGGLQGQVEIMMGGEDQLVSPQLASRLGSSPADLPGFRGFLSLFFRGPAPGRGFYWAATNPYIKPLWIKVARFPRTLSSLYAEIPRGVFDGPMSVYFVMDGSGSMSSGNMASMKQAVNLVLDRLPYQHRIDIGGVVFNAGDRRGYVNASPAQVASFRSWVNSLVASGGTDFLIGMQGAVDWFNQTAGDRGIERRVMFFITDGAAEGNSDDQARAAGIHLIQRAIPVDIYAISIGSTDTSSIAKIDNTPADGLPVVSGDTADALADTLLAALGDAEFDANPSHIIFECLTNTDWGMGEDPLSLDTESFMSAAGTLYAEQLGLSLSWNQAATIEDFINDILGHINGVIFTHPRTGKITLRLIRDDYNVEELRVINPDNATLTSFARKAWGETVNEMKVSWTNPETEQEETVYSQDLGNIALQGAVISDSKNYHGVRSAGLAQQLCNRELRVSSAPLSSAEAELDRSFWDITPYEVLILDWPEYDINGLIVRATEVSYGTRSNPKIKVNLLEDVFSLPQAHFITPPSSDWVDPAQPPLPVTHARVIPAPAYALVSEDVSLETLSYPSTAASLLVASPYQFGSVSYSAEIPEPTASGGTEWVMALDHEPFAGRGLLADPLPLEATSTLTGLDEQVGPAPWLDHFLVIGPDEAPADELEIALVSAVDENTGAVTLSRGVLDTVPGSWPVGTPAWVIPADLLDPLPQELTAGQTLEARILSNTTSGQTDNELSPVISGVVQARPTLPLRPANVQMNGIGFGEVQLEDTLTLTWSHRNRLLEDIQVLDWTAPSTPLEPGVSYTVEIDAVEPDGTAIVGWVTEDVGTAASFSLDLLANPPPPTAAKLRARVLAVRGDESSWQTYQLVGALPGRGAAPTVVAYSETPFATGTSVTVTIPMNTEAGDRLIAFVMTRSPLIVPAGWEVIDEVGPYSDLDQRLYALQRVAGADDAGTEVTWEQSANERMAAHIMVARMADATPVVLEVAKSESDATPYSDLNIPPADGSAGQLFLTAGSTNKQSTAGENSWEIIGDWRQTTPSSSTDTANQIRMGCAYWPLPVDTTASGRHALSPDLNQSNITGFGAITLVLGVLEPMVRVTPQGGRRVTTQGDLRVTALGDGSAPDPG